MLEFVKKDKLEMVSNKIKNIYDKRVGKDKTTFIINENRRNVLLFIKARYSM